VRSRGVEAGGARGKVGDILEPCLAAGLCRAAIQSSHPLPCKKQERGKRPPIGRNGLGSKVTVGPRHQHSLDRNGLCAANQEIDIPGFVNGSKTTMAALVAMLRP
jgi:hypothetical protein